MCLNKEKRRRKVANDFWRLLKSCKTAVRVICRPFYFVTIEDLLEFKQQVTVTSLLVNAHAVISLSVLYVSLQVTCIFRCPMRHLLDWNETCRSFLLKSAEKCKLRCDAITRQTRDWRLDSKTWELHTVPSVRFGFGSLRLWLSKKQQLVMGEWTEHRAPSTERRDINQLIESADSFNFN